MNITLDWLIGLIEGKGYLGKQAKYYSTGKIFYPYFQISYEERELLEEVKEYLGFGKVYKVKNGYLLKVFTKDDSVKLMKLLEGKLKSSKMNIQYEEWKQYLSYELIPYNELSRDERIKCDIARKRVENYYARKYGYKRKRIKREG